MSNLFELLIYSSKLGRFEQWFDCFTILFGVSPSILNEEYESLKEMVHMEIEENLFMMYDYSFSNFTWINELISTNSWKGNHYNKMKIKMKIKMKTNSN